MIHPAHWDSISDMLIADDFYLAAHRVIFQEMENLLRQGKPIDLINLYEFLREKNLSEDVGGFAYLAELSKTHQVYPILFRMPLSCVIVLFCVI